MVAQMLAPALGRQIPVYVVHFEAPEWCSETVASLRRSDVAVEPHVVDNGGLGPFPDAEVFTLARNRGFSGAANVALGHWLATSAEPYCVVTAHDLLLEPDALRIMADVLDAHPTIGIVAPRIVGTGRTPRENQADLFERRRQRPAPDLVAIEGLRRCSWASGTCLMFRRACVEDVGPFNERFGSYAEDVDYCFRANERTWGVVVAEAARGDTRGSAASELSHVLKGSNAYLTSIIYGGRRSLLRRIRRSLAALLVSVVVPARFGVAGGRARLPVRIRWRVLSRGLAVSAVWYRDALLRRLGTGGAPAVLCTDDVLLDELQQARKASS
jgi:N-acetylglucosaminyl-diphospho-decaprenol L-rhamnosyltransferase